MRNFKPNRQTRRNRKLVDPPGVVFDLEGNGLEPTKLHCLSMTTNGSDIFSTTDYLEMGNFFEDQEIIVGHNIVCFDVPVVERLVAVSVNCRVVDTLALSWYLEFDRPRHGLASFGEEFGVPKPLVDDWSDQPVEVYINRCEEDVKINWLLWKRLWNKLLELYDDDLDKIWELIDYLTFKMSVAQKQSLSKWKVDLELATKTKTTLETLRDEKILELGRVMPKVPITKVRSYPAKPLKKDGSLSSHGVKWMELLEEKGLPRTYKEDIEVIVGYEEPNPGSHVQIKRWLYSLGWVPITYKHKRDKVTGEIKSTEQINKEHGGGICDSIKALFKKEPSLEVLDGLSVIVHRLGLINGFIDNVDSEGFVKAEISGFTNTLRVKHKTVVNLPKVGKPYGEEIRGCLVARPGKILCGSDQASLEDRLKQHYLFKFDPEYVAKVSKDDYDPHLDLALMGKMLIQEQVDAYIRGVKEKTDEGKEIKPVRDIAKNGNYSLYGEYKIA